MYLRTTTRRAADGSTVRYLQLAHNVWDPATRRSKVRVLYHLGREDGLDRDAIRRLIRSLSRVLEPGEALALASPELRLVESRPYGGAWLLDRLWEQLGLPAILAGALRGRRRDPAVERVLFALVANRALEPMSKLSCTTWVGEHVAIPGLAELAEDRCYRAMDWLLQVEAEVAEQVYWSVATLLDLEVDLLFFDTTSYLLRDRRGGQPRPRAPPRASGPTGTPRTTAPTCPRSSSASRSREPASPSGYGPGPATPTTRRSSARSRRTCGPGGWGGWCGSRTGASTRRRTGATSSAAATTTSWARSCAARAPRPGRRSPVRAATTVVAGNLEVKEVVVDEGTMRDRFVICRNPEEAERDAAVRQQLLEQLGTMIAGSDQRSAAERDAIACKVRVKPGLGRFLRVTRAGLLREDRAAVAAEQKLDGKFLLRTSDPTLSAEDVALGYKQLLEVERAWRDMKTTLDLRPIFHRKEERIRAHVLLCWLALLLIRLAETGTGDTWRNVRREMDKLHLVRLEGPTGEVLQRTETTPRQAALLKALSLPEPPRILGLTPSLAAATA